MGVFRTLVGAIPLFFLSIGIASAATGVLGPTSDASPLAGTMLVLVGLALFVSLWLVGWWSRETPTNQ